MKILILTKICLNKEIIIKYDFFLLRKIQKFGLLFNQNPQVWNVQINNFFIKNIFINYYFDKTQEPYIFRNKFL